MNNALLQRINNINGTPIGVKQNDPSVLNSISQFIVTNSQNNSKGSITDLLTTPSTYSPLAWVVPEFGTSLNNTVTKIGTTTGNIVNSVESTLDTTLDILPYIPYMALALLGFMAVNTVNNVTRR